MKNTEVDQSDVKIAIVAALKREVWPLVKRWRASERENGGRKFRFFERANVVLVCGGIGAVAARRAAEAVIVLYAPELIVSAGFAGALEASLRVGDVMQPERVINANDGSSVMLEHGHGVLVSFAAVAGPEQKARLRESYGAQAVDMEAAAVAQAAEARGIKFRAIKAISDEVDFVFPSMERFVNANGSFSEWKFAGFAALRPWLWPRVVRLMRSSRRASRVLCEWLGRIDQSGVGHNKSHGVETGKRA